MLLNDPPDHTRLRKLVSQTFTPRVTEQLRTPIAETAASLLNDVKATGALDPIVGYAFPPTLHVIAALIGGPAEQQDRLLRRSGVLIRTLDLAPAMADFREAERVAHEAFAFF